MRFEGTVQLNAPRLQVWDLLMQESVFEKISPGVSHVRALVPQERYLLNVGVPIGNLQITTVEAEVVWDHVIEAERLDWSSCVPFAGQIVAAHGALYFSGDARCQIEFRAAITELPKSLPPALVHKMTSSGIRSFFSQLKAEVEAAPIPVAAFD